MISYEPLYKTVKDKNTSLQELSIKCGFAKGTIATILSHNRDLNTSMINKICEALECGPSDIFEVVEDGTVIEHKRTVNQKNRKRSFNVYAIDWEKFTKDIKDKGYTYRTLSLKIGKPWNFIANKKQKKNISEDSLKLIADGAELNWESYI